VFEKNAEAAMMDDSLKPVRGESIEDEPVSEEAKLPKAPEWTKLAAIFVTSGIFALIEWFICESELPIFDCQAVLNSQQNVCVIQPTFGPNV
jgi:hypothetical protein